MAEVNPEEMARVIKTNIVDDQDGVEIADDQTPTTEIIEEDDE